MSKFGQGFGRDAVPATRSVVKTENQKAYSLWCNRDKTKPVDERPDWLVGKSKYGAPSPSRVGEWKLVWKAKDSEVNETKNENNTEQQQTEASTKTPQPTSSKPPTGLGQQRTHRSQGTDARQPASRTSQRTRSVVDGAKPSRETGSVSGRDQQKSSGTGLVAPLDFKTLNLARPNSSFVPRASARSQASSVSGSSFLSKTSTMSKCTLSTTSSKPKRLGTARSGRSMSSMASYSSLGSSASVEHNEILRRIEGLEQALRTEKELRVRMQSLLETSEG
mmetsp:Transcript_10649/g.21305  ORF Transcript_10649/g.21305 Transcript_10649/m.21305 type:complete len:278 (-) Transcript_10649:468-1301(-)